MATILLTGVTGTVGSALAPLLIGRGHRLICLVRGDNPVARIEKALGGASGVHILRGDIVTPGLGVSSLEMQRWRGRIDKVIHCASAIQFEESQAKEITATNVFGTANVMVFASHMQIPDFHYVSTAYVAGDADVFREIDLDIGQTGRNVYERTKLEAEKMVRRWKGGNYSIYRLGIVVGDTSTGRADAFNGYYVFMGCYCELKELCIRRLAEGKIDAGGIILEPDGTLWLPVQADFSPVSTLNMVPVDWAAKALADLAGVSACGRVFNVVHPNPPKIQWVNDVSLKILGIAGFRYGPAPDFGTKTLLGKVQRILTRGTIPYIPYIGHEAKFDVSNLPLVLGREYTPPPDIDEAFIKMLLDYARSVNFGRGKKQVHEAVM